MGLIQYGDNDGNGISHGGSSLHYDLAGNVVETLASGASRTTKDHTGAVIERIDANSRQIRVARVALAAADTGGGVFAWQNPEASAIVIGRIEIDVTTVATGAATIDVGTTATNATTSSDNLIDGLDVNAAVITADNITDKGTNGKSRQKLASGKWVTASKASGACAGLAGYAYIHYHLA